MSHKLLLALVLLMAATRVAPQTGNTREDKSPHTGGFVAVNGVKLHYLDWGGEGETLLFITGSGDDAHVFDEMAPKFTDRFRVLALTRRGYGESDKYRAEAGDHLAGLLRPHPKLVESPSSNECKRW